MSTELGQQRAVSSYTGLGKQQNELVHGVDEVVWKIKNALKGMLLFSECPHTRPKSVDNYFTI
jgi:hypothetical protein